MLETILNQAFFLSLLAATVRMATPILYTALGELYAERSGVLNIGCEGAMLVGSLCAFLAAFYLNNPWAGVLAGMAGGAFIGLIMAFLSVSLMANQVVAGIVLNLFSIGLTSFFFRVLFGTSSPSVAGFGRISFPLLGEIPFLGKILFQQDISVYISIILVLIAGIILYHTAIGLKIIAAGENPRAADTLGVNVYRVRYLCVIFGSIMAGLGGSFLMLSHVKMFVDNVTAGRGFMAIAVVIFGKWNPYKAIIGVLLFGMADSLQLRLQAAGINIPFQFLLILPYLLTIIVLVSSKRKTMEVGKPGGPASMVVPYEKEEG